MDHTWSKFSTDDTNFSSVCRCVLAMLRFSLNPLLLSKECSVATAKLPSVTGGKDASGNQWRGLLCSKCTSKAFIIG